MPIVTELEEAKVGALTETATRAGMFPKPSVSVNVDAPKFADAPLRVHDVDVTFPERENLFLIVVEPALAPTAPTVIEVAAPAKFTVVEFVLNRSREFPDCSPLIAIEFVAEPLTIEINGVVSVNIRKPAFANPGSVWAMTCDPLIVIFFPAAAPILTSVPKGAIVAN